MKIGIDIDNVISNFNDELLKEYVKHDKKLRGTGIINENPYYITRGMFDWTDEENEQFYRNNIERIASNLKPIRNAKKVIDRLKQEGNEIYIISNRDNGEYTDAKTLTTNWLKKYNIYYDKLILTNFNKGQVCKENHIDIMIEDSIRHCVDIMENGIKCFMMTTRYNKHSNIQIEKVSSWEEIYKKINESIQK